MRWNTLLLAIIVSVSAFTVQSCTAGYYGPPGTAGHGYVAVHSGVELVFDSGLGLYIVTGHPNYYYYGGYYYRVHDGGRYGRCRTIDGPWSSINPSKLPPGLAKKYDVHPTKHQGKGNRKHGR
ncbi:MAG: hypothetical protein WC674_06605 [Candidatus Krumholzibacteriia bacterium]